MRSHIDVITRGVAQMIMAQYGITKENINGILEGGSLRLEAKEYLKKFEKSQPDIIKILPKCIDKVIVDIKFLTKNI